MRRFSITLVASLLLISGCASKYGSQMTDVNYYPNCYQPLGELRASEEKVQTGTGAGVAIGAVLGALIGYAATGKAYGAVAGAAAGAVVGGVAGYSLASYQEETDAKVRLASYAESIDADVSQMDIATASAAKARQCYENAFNAAREDFVNNRISASEFEARYKEIRSGLLETSSILNDVSLNMTARDKEYRDALAWEADQRELPAPDPQAYAVANAPQKEKAKPAVAPKPSPDPELDQMARQSATFINSQAALDQERAATEAAISVFDQNAHDLMGIGA